MRGSLLRHDQPTQENRCWRFNMLVFYGCLNLSGCRWSRGGRGGGLDWGEGFDGVNFTRSIHRRDKSNPLTWLPNCNVQRVYFAPFFSRFLIKWGCRDTAFELFWGYLITVTRLMQRLTNMSVRYPVGNQKFAWSSSAQQVTEYFIFNPKYIIM